MRRVFPRVDRFEGLRKFEIFSNLNAYHLHVLNKYLHLRDYQAGEMIYEKGFPLETVLFVDSGEVDIFADHEIDQFQTLGSGEIIGLQDLYSHDVRSDYAKARSSVSLYAMSKVDMTEMIKQNRELGTIFLTNVCAYLSKLSKTSGSDRAQR